MDDYVYRGDREEKRFSPGISSGVAIISSLGGVVASRQFTHRRSRSWFTQHNHDMHLVLLADGSRTTADLLLHHLIRP